MAEEPPTAEQLPAQAPLVFNREIKALGWGYLHARCKHGSSMSELYSRPNPPPTATLEYQQTTLTIFHKTRYPACDCNPVGPPAMTVLPAEVVE